MAAVTACKMHEGYGESTRLYDLNDIYGYVPC